MGFRPVVFELESIPAGMLAVGVPEYRLPRSVLQAEVALIRVLGVEIRCNTEVGKDISLTELLADFPAVVIAVGAKKSRRLDLPGVEGHCYQAKGRGLLRQSGGDLWQGLTEDLLDGGFVLLPRLLAESGQDATEGLEESPVSGGTCRDGQRPVRGHSPDMAGNLVWALRLGPASSRLSMWDWPSPGCRRRIPGALTRVAGGRRIAGHDSCESRTVPWH